MVLSPEGVWYLYMVGPPPIAMSVVLALTNRKRPVRISMNKTPDIPSPPVAGMRLTALCSCNFSIGRLKTCSIRRFIISIPVRSPL